MRLLRASISPKVCVSPFHSSAGSFECWRREASNLLRRFIRGKNQNTLSRIEYSPSREI